MSLHLLGIRHHGPGSSRHVLDALHTIRPDILLIEGPPEGETMLPWVTHSDMKPPVALLAYVPDHPDQAVFYPFAAFSPEWNAIQYALKNGIPVRFIDMPLAHSLVKVNEPDTRTVPAMDLAEENKPSTHADIPAIRQNPVAYLAEIAGFEDAEEWWEHKFEIANHPAEVFSAIASSMEALRNELPHKKDNDEALREAFMRKAIRTAQKELYTKIAVICGAWHVPALSNMPRQKDDNVLLKNLPKVKVETTWIPWTNDRLSLASGYGAGLESPGWYSHAWHHPEDGGALWLSHAARIFRAHQVAISSAHIIESVRLANALAGLRHLHRPGLKEFNESILAVMCMGDPIFMNLIHRELIVGNALGQIPEGTPQVPVQRDLEQQIRRLRLKISNDEKHIKLDLRNENDLEKSILLHRLIALEVDWAKLQHSSSKGTFKEEWSLLWYPELTIKLLEKAAWGNTIEEAANKYLEHEARNCTRLDEITALIQKALPSDLQSAVAFAIQRMDELAASTADTTVLMNAFIPLVQVNRYGNVRKTDLEAVNVILKAVFYRIAASLPLSCTGIDEEQAVTITEKIRDVNQSILLLEEEELKASWTETIKKIVASAHAAPMVQGYCCKTLYDARVLDHESMSNEFSKVLSINNSPDFSAAWLEGFLNDAATVLVLDDNIWNIVNDWLLGLEETVFLQVIPLLRRTFSVYSNVEKQKIAQRARQAKPVSAGMEIHSKIDEERAKQVLPVLEKLMGL
ncbi:DUF5682 family protein [Dyadobacter sediminis]|uniref:Protein FAM107A/FAM107B n=1 Tax=Dyadobacter sediminis TaxID=1493691 RepID=A0A5R9KAS5_9BACT|nr:DUF5682 family protein [Dyadobacter sediminis]TLU91931.1 protein FAM107A/FAM107B [Dyadobacter sediminis]GGB99016.1 hypothetical protein GCM10011325_27790 [Dyadobacter sediminis]